MKKAPWYILAVWALTLATYCACSSPLGAQEAVPDIGRRALVDATCFYATGPDGTVTALSCVAK